MDAEYIIITIQGINISNFFSSSNYIDYACLMTVYFDRHLASD